MSRVDLRITLLVIASVALPVLPELLFMRSGEPASSPRPAAAEEQSVFQLLAAHLPRIQTALAAGPSVMVPQGTVFRVRTMEFIDVDSTQAGAHFRGTLDDPIMIDGNVVVPRGADVVLVAAKVEQGGRMKGSDLIQLKANSIVVRGHAHQVVTTVAETKTGGEGKKTTGKVLGGAGLGALIGGIAGGGKGAGIGALVGGAGGTIMAASGQPHLKIPAETRLQFQLMTDWRIR